MLQPERDLGEVRDGLTAWLRTRMPEARQLAISELTRPKAGFSNDTLLFEVSHLTGGDVTILGVFNIASSKPQLLAIVGGTGRYRGARGELNATLISDTKEKFVYTIVT